MENNNIDPFMEEDWGEKELNYSDYNHDILRFLNDNIDRNIMIDLYINLIRYFVSNKISPNIGFFEDFLSIMIEIGVDEDDLKKIKIDVRNLFNFKKIIESFEPEEEWEEELYMDFNFDHTIYDRDEIPFEIGDRVYISTNNGPRNDKIISEKGTIQNINTIYNSYWYISVNFDRNINGNGDGYNWKFNGRNYQCSISSIPMNESFEPEEEWEEEDNSDVLIFDRPIYNRNEIPFNKGDKVRFKNPYLLFDNDYKYGSIYRIYRTNKKGIYGIMI